MDKSRKSRVSSGAVSTTDETTPLTAALDDGAPPNGALPHLELHPEPGDLAKKNQDHESPPNSPDDLEFVDNDLYERDSDGGNSGQSGPTAVANHVEDDETYEIPEDVVGAQQEAPPPVPLRTSSSPARRPLVKNSDTPPVPFRHSSLATFTPPLPPRSSSRFSLPPPGTGVPTSKSTDRLFQPTPPKLPLPPLPRSKQISRSIERLFHPSHHDQQSKNRLSPRLSLLLTDPKPEESVFAAEPKRASSATNQVALPRADHVVQSSSESEPSTPSSSDDESDFEDLPPPRENAPPLPEGAEAVVPAGATGGATASSDPAESDYLEPISLRDPESVSLRSDGSHDYDPVYMPTNPGASHIAHLVDNTNYLKGARNRSNSKASISGNPYEEIQFGGTEVYADVDESTMTSPPIQDRVTSSPVAPAPPRLTARSSRKSDLVPLTPPQVTPRSSSRLNGATNGFVTSTPLIPPRTTSASAATPKLPPRCPSSSDHTTPKPFPKAVLRLPLEPRYSGLLADTYMGDEESHDYTPLDYDDHQTSTAGDANNNKNKIPEIEERPWEKQNTSQDGLSSSLGLSSTEVLNEDDSDYDPVANDDGTEQVLNPDEIYEPIEGADNKDAIYEAIDFGDSD